MKLYMRSQFREEVQRHLATFASKELPDNIRIRLVLLPLESKKQLQRKLHEKLEIWQLI